MNTNDRLANAIRTLIRSHELRGQTQCELSDLEAVLKEDVEKQDEEVNSMLEDMWHSFGGE
mgnify:CR=1 FL=1